MRLQPTRLWTPSLSSPWLSKMAAAGICAGLVACAGNSKPQTAPAAPAAIKPATPPAQAAPPADPITILINTSQAHFKAGEAALQAGHLDRARLEFDQSVEVLLESPYGARSDARLREHFDRLVDRINAYEMTALAQGDGFTEKKYEAATIDELLSQATTFPAPPPDTATQAAVAADLQRDAHDLPIPQQSKVLSYVELFQTKLRGYIQDSLDRGASYLPMIQNVFRAEGLPLDLAYIPIIESSFKTNALSKASAKGPWQFMKATAKEQGLETNWFVDERSDPEKATEAAADYLKSLNKMFDGNWDLVLAAYNGGPGRVQRAMKRSGLTDFWALARTAKYLPRETREYVPMIYAAMIIARNPIEYGFEVAASAPLAYDTVTVPRAVDLRRVAEWTGTTVDEIQALNPELRRWTTPVRQARYDLKVPDGTADELQARLANASPTEFTALKWHTVRRGETLLSIARKLGVRRTDLAGANNLSIHARVRTGQELIIPRAPTILAARAERPAPVAVASRSLASSADTPAAVHAPNVHEVYRVKRGDTLFGIAQLFDTTVAKIKSWNRLHGDVINPGTRLKILADRSR
ncbi:MAG TPA: LysM peptidoglycan-binding domain-containing protein [Vicinamibacterales bacterium]|nr:LysM peptidoglycan-binding domain-containing protein [Vicinamibacterales bacterium]